MQPIELAATQYGHRATFSAMANPCELLVETDDAALARHLGEIVAAEAWRIEQKFSRYRDDSVIAAIQHTTAGNGYEVDSETASLLNFAGSVFTISNGLFDITSGVLRKIWKFDRSTNIPTRKQAKALLPLIGWDKVEWQEPFIRLRPGMELDFGGFGKEYAVDRALQLAEAVSGTPMLVNFGGDMRANRAPTMRDSWDVGIESVSNSLPAGVVHFRAEALVSSGDSRNYLEKNGVRYPHILNPHTAWPVMGAPHAVTVLGPTCIEAGFIATLALLKGRAAESFLASQGFQHHVQR